MGARKKYRHSISSQWIDGEWWVHVDDGRDPMMIMIDTEMALDFLIKANADVAKLNAAGKLNKVA